jgi:lysophospholipase L1-like esterase
VNPKVIVLQAGTNNVGARVPPEGIEAAAKDVSIRMEQVLHIMREKAPNAVIIVTAIFPRNDNMAVLPEIDRINASLAKFADGKKIRYLNVNGKLADREGKLHDGMMNERDKLHPNEKAYQIWADALKPIFTEVLGPPAAEDHAPPPTGDPSKAKPATNF